MKFMYIGEGVTEAFGIRFKAGASVEVTDAHAIRKLKHNHLFTHNEEPETVKTEEAAPVAPKRRGRTPNAQQ